MTNDVRYLWCGEQLCQKRSAGDTVMARYYREGEMNIGWLGAYYARDHLGSVRDILNANTGSRLKSLNYSPRGQIYNSDGFFEAEFEFAGMQSFPFMTNGPLLTYHRVYHSGLGRWLSRDPIAENGGINLYGYVGGNPVSYIDPWGLEKIILFPPKTPERKAAEGVPDTLGVCTIYAHGKPGVISPTTSAKDALDPTALKKIVETQCQPKEPVQLMSCDGGTDGDSSVAKKLSDALGGTLVSGYDGYVVYVPATPFNPAIVSPLPWVDNQTYSK